MTKKQKAELEKEDKEQVFYLEVANDSDERIICEHNIAFNSGNKALARRFKALAASRGIEYLIEPEDVAFVG